MQIYQLSFLALTTMRWIKTFLSIGLAKEIQLIRGVPKLSERLVF